MPGTWDFGGAYADTAATLQNTEHAAQKMNMLSQAFPGELAHTQSTTRLNNANAAVSENALQARQNLAQIMQSAGGQPQPGESQSSYLMRTAGAALKAGDSATAQSLITHAAQVKTQEAREAEYATRAAKIKADVQMKQADRWNNLLANVQSQEDLDRARFLWQAEFGEPAPNMRYDPETVRLMRDSSMKMRDKIQAEHFKAAEAIAKASLGERASYHRGVLELRSAAEERRRNADAAKAKVGGKDVGAPSKGEQDAAFDLLKSEKLDWAGNRASFDVAARARALRRNNPGLDAGEATQRALTEMQGEGYFATKQIDRLGGLFKSQEKTYGKPGGSAERSLPVPMAAGKPDASKLKPNTYYMTPKGSLLYLGNGKWQAPAAAPAHAGGAEDDDEED